MKVQFLPETQQANNNKIVRGLRRIGLLAWLLLAVAVVVGGTLYWRGPVVTPPPVVFDAVSGVVIAEAILVSPEFVIIAGDGPAQADLVATTRRAGARKVRSAPAAGAPFTLYRLDANSGLEPAIPTVPAVPESVIAQRAGAIWEGTVTALESARLVVDPEVTVQPGTGVFVKGQPLAIVGVTAAVGNEIRVLPIAAILDAFTEIAGPR